MKKSIIAVAGLFILSSLSFASIPGLINYQGILKDSTGHVVSNPALPMTFSIYAGATGGTALWSEMQTVSVESGNFSAQLGSVNPIGTSIFDGAANYLGVKAGTDSEMTPRVVLVTVPYAYRSSIADFAASSGPVNLIRIATSEDPAISAESTATGGTGIYGKGKTFGGYFISTDVMGAGVFGYAPSGMTAGVQGAGDTVGVAGQSNGSNGDGVQGFAYQAGRGVAGISTNGVGVYGYHQSTTGVLPGVSAETRSTSPYAAAITGKILSNVPGTYASAIRGINNGTNGNGIGVWGSSDGGSGGYGVYGTSNSSSGYGVYGQTDVGYGVYGISTNGGIAVMGDGQIGGNGIWGQSDSGCGVFGQTGSVNSYGGSFFNSGGGVACYVNSILRLYPRGAAPSTASEGMIYYNSTTHKAYCYDGTVWQAMW
ncbi:MAG TPA: hypothetical protein VMD02_03310 [Candidatus Omnitrophota bacterium]|nr:hypothetical protein [Candidatus Omnitrophota bacterium]